MTVGGERLAAEKTMAEPTKVKRGVSMTDIAREAKVSQATVSYILNSRQNKYITEETRERVLAVAQEMGYRPNRMAQALVTGRTNLLDMVLPTLGADFYMLVASAFSVAFRETEFDLRFLLRRFSAPKDWEKGGLWKVDGIILFDSAMPPSVRSFYLTKNVPVVVAGSYTHEEINQFQPTNYAIVDIGQAATVALQRLRASGRKRIAFITAGTFNLADDTTLYAESEDRLAAYRRFIRASDSEEIIIRLGVYWHEEWKIQGLEKIAECLRRADRPDAILALNDTIAIATVKIARSLGLRIPDDVAIIGFDDIPDAAHCDPPLTTVAYPYHEVANAARDVLLGTIANPANPPKPVVLVPQLVVRQSAPVAPLEN